MELVRMLNVSKIYPGSGEKVLKDVNISVNSGDFISVEGVSGSGKSTLLYILAGLTAPTEGEVAYGGKNIFALGDRELSEWRGKHIGYLFQNVHMAKALTVRENIAFARRFGNDPGADPDELIKAMGLEEVADKLPGRISGGQKRRAMIASVLIRRPQIILADEPTNDLDKEWASKVMEYLQGYITGDRAMILVTHDMSWADMASVRYHIVDGVISLKQ